jgi:hypothetical protein
MTEWAVSFGWNWLLVPFLVWFVRGVCVAYLRPRLKYRLHSKTKSGYLLSVTRQELLPPWRALDETYLVPEIETISREGDGWVPPRDTYHPNDPRFWSAYEKRIRGCLAAAIARDEETDDLVSGLGKP